MSTPTPSIRARGAVRAAGGLMGVAEVAEALDVKTSNVGKVAGLVPLGRIPGGSVYLRCEVEALSTRLTEARARRAGASE